MASMRHRCRRSEPWILTRFGADTTAEIGSAPPTSRSGTANLSTQWQCSLAGTLNTDPNQWVKASSRRPMCRSRPGPGRATFHFGTASNYTTNRSGTATPRPVCSFTPSTLKFSHGNAAPLGNHLGRHHKPTLPTAPPAGTVGRYTRWAASNALEDAQLQDRHGD
jgi:hypothetical protein